MSVFVGISLLVLVAVLFGAFLWVNSILVFNMPRYMAVVPGMLWRDTRYLRKLPNVLKQLYYAGFQSPWPLKPTAISALFFRRKLFKVLRSHFPDARRLIQQHLSLWAFIQLHADELQQELLKRQLHRARTILNESFNADVRRDVLAFVERCKKSQSRLARRCPSPTSTAGTVDWLVRLRSFDVLMREHGYHVTSEFATLYWWEAAGNETILQELSPGMQGKMNSSYTALG